MGTIADHQAGLEQLLAGLEDTYLTTDPAKAETHRPCLLIGPPTLDLQRRAVSHRLLALAGHPAGHSSAMRQLDELVTVALEQLEGYVERAEPTSYALTSDAGGTVPAYLLTVTL